MYIHMLENFHCHDYSNLPPLLDHLNQLFTMRQTFNSQNYFRKGFTLILIIHLDLHLNILSLISVSF